MTEEMTGERTEEIGAMTEEVQEAGRDAAAEVEAGAVEEEDNYEKLRAMSYGLGVNKK